MLLPILTFLKVRGADRLDRPTTKRDGGRAPLFARGMSLAKRAALPEAGEAPRRSHRVSLLVHDRLFIKTAVRYGTAIWAPFRKAADEASQRNGASSLPCMSMGGVGVSLESLDRPAVSE